MFLLVPKRRLRFGSGTLQPPSAGPGRPLSVLVYAQTQSPPEVAHKGKRGFDYWKKGFDGVLICF